MDLYCTHLIAVHRTSTGNLFPPTRISVNSYYLISTKTPSTDPCSVTNGYD